MSAPEDAAPRSPEAIQLAAEAIMGALVMRARSGTSISLWAEIADRVPCSDGLTVQMALDYLVRGGWLTTRQMPGNGPTVVVLYLDEAPRG